MKGIPVGSNEIEKDFAEFTKANSIEGLHVFFRRICLYLGLDERHPLVSVFDTANGEAIKKMVASCLLRVVSQHSKILWEDTALRLKVSTLWDDVYSKDIYKILKLTGKIANHDLFRKMEEVESTQLRQFEDLAGSMISVETASEVRRRYQKLLSSPLTKIFSESQIYDRSLVSPERVAEVFNALDGYIESDRVNSSKSFSRLEDVITKYDEDIRRHGANIYVETFVSKIIHEVLSVTALHFELSGSQQSAELVIAGTDRKYPLHTTGEVFSYRMNLVNVGPGIAYNVQINILEVDSSIEVESQELSLGALDVGIHEFIVNMRSNCDAYRTPSILGLMSWTDYSGVRTEIDFELLIIPQNGTLDWQKIKYLQPYSLESVDSEDELIGRKDMLENIYSKLSLRKGESSIIYGQKRVGKTSLAKTIQNRFKAKANHIAIFIETGSLDKTSPGRFIKSLGDKVIRSLARHVSIDPESYKVDSSLSPLVSCIEDIVHAHPDLKIVLIIDEFDEIPSQLYPYTIEGDSFFHNLRSFSGESGEGRVSLILVGGENMGVIMQSTDKLNKFDASNVGYFNKSECWEDFKELLVTPVRDVMEYSDEAILKLYEATEGNPFYTKFVAKVLYKKMCDRRCSFISADEIEDAVRDSVQTMEAINLNHFWSDGIRVEDPERRDLIETERRRFLISFADKLREHGTVDKKMMFGGADFGVQKEILDSFVSRNILVEEEGSLRIKPKLFERWLVEKGVHTLRAAFADEEALSAFEARESAAYIPDSSLISLADSWELYRGRRVGSSEIRAWLAQFESNAERCLAFKILENINFYGEARVREKLKIIHDVVRREVVYSVKSGERSRRDIIVSAFGPPSKSGSSYLRMYVSENGIISNGVKSSADIPKALSGDEQTKAVVFIDDIIGSGTTMIDCLREFSEAAGEMISQRDILVVVGVICGLRSGVEKVLQVIDSGEFPFRVELKVCDVLDEGDRAFSQVSQLFDEGDKHKAQVMARKYGSKLQSRHPLGYADSQLLVVFKDNCPNNTLPIIWCTGENPKWVPIFKRI